MISDKKNKYAKFENIFPFFLEAIEDLIIIVSLDNSFKIEYIHECEFLEQLGYSYDTLLGKSLLNLVDFGVKSSKKELLGIIQQNKNRQDVKVIKKNGKLTWVEFISTIFNDEKNQQKLVVKLRDISKRKELEIKLEELEKRLEKISKIVPEIRFWEIFTPKKYDQALKESEALLKTALECLPFDIYMINKDGYYAMQNSTSKELWGDIIGKRPEEVANDQETLAIWKDNNSRAFSGETVIGEVRFKINGFYHHFYKIINPVYINDEIQYIIGVNIDITELKSTEQKLEESKERYREMIDNLDVGFFRVSLDGTILIHNRKYNEIFGISPLESLIDEKTFNFWKNQEDRKKFLMDLMKTGKVKNYIVSAKKINGETIILQVNSHLIKDDKGIPIATEGTIIDITEKYSLQRELEESEKKYRDIAELLPDVIFETDLNLNLTYVNSIAFKLFGYTEEDLRSGLNITQFLDPLYKEKALKNIKLLLENKETTSQEYLLVKKDGTTFYTIIHSKPNFKNEKIVGIRGTITDINNFIKAKQELKESEDKFRTIAEQSFMGIIILQDGVFKYFNEQAKKLNGYSEEEIRNWKPYEFTKLIHPEDREFVSKQAKKKESGDKNVVIYYKYRLITKTGEVLWIENYSKSIIFKGRTADLIMSVDITDNVNAEQKLKESEEKYRLINENANDLIAVIDHNFNYSFVNDAYLSLGYSIDEIPNLKPADFIHPNDFNRAIKTFKECLKTGAGLEELRFKHVKGHYSWFEVKGKTFKDKNGDLKLLLISRDITERKKTERKIRESEDKFRTIAEQSLMGICIIQDFEIKYLNHQMAEIYGYHINEIKQWKPKEFLKVIHPNSKEMVINQLKKKQQGSEDVIIHYIAKIIKKNGSIRYVENYSKPISYQGRPADLLTQIDITARMNAEQKLQSSEKKYRHLYENSPNAILLFNMKGEILDCNLISEELSGFNRDDLIGNNFQNNKFIPRTFLPIILEDFKALLKGIAMEPREIQIKTKGEALLWVNVQASLFDYENEKIIQVIIQIIDEKKKAEQKLKESEAKYRSLFENMNAGFAYHKVIVNDNNDPIDYKYLEVNPAFETLTGLKKEDLIGKTVTEAIPGTENDPADWISKFGKVGLTGIPLIVEDYSEGIDKWFKVSGYSPKKEYFAVTFTDITERKQAEERLKESEAKYHKLFETSPDGVILTDLKGNIIECNSALEDITGYSPREFIGKNFMKLDIYHENGLEKLLEGYKDLLEENQLEHIKFPIKRKDNQINWVEIRSTLIDMKGQSYILTVIHDITTQKQAGEAIKRSEERYRDLLETSSVGVIELDVIKNEIIYINPKLVEIIGYVKEELTEDHFLNKLIHPKDLRKVLDSNEESELEIRIFDKSGKLKWLTGKRIPRFNENGQMINIRVWLEDITEKKMYENLIYELNVNFLNFTADIKNNIHLLLNTCLNLLNGDFILYINKTEDIEQDTYQILTSDKKSFMCNAEFFADNLFVSALFYESHDFPQTFFDINKMSFANTDPFIARYNLKGCFGKLIKSQNDLEGAVCVFYKRNPAISNQDKLVMFLICDAIEIEQRRWQVQRGLEEQNITLNKINKLKTELFSRTSHELKTPLISIKGFTELLLTLHKSKLDNDVISILEEIKDGSKRLEKIIYLLLESTKLEAGQLELNLSKEDLNFLINFCVKELKGLAKLRNQSIKLKLHDKLETEFDKERIYEVFSNLLVNAIKYTPPEGYIAIESTIKNGFYLISVKDNGIGFTTEEKNQVFKQFGKIERYGQGWDVTIEGTGLGLYITKKLVELHGGKIWLESEGRNKGSTFYFTLPIKN